MTATTNGKRKVRKVTRKQVVDLVDYLKAHHAIYSSGECTHQELEAHCLRHTGIEAAWVTLRGILNDWGLEYNIKRMDLGKTRGTYISNHDLNEKIATLGKVLTRICNQQKVVLPPELASQLCDLFPSLHVKEGN